MLLGFLPKDSLLVEIMPYHFGDPTYGRLASAFDLQYMHVVSEPVRKLQVWKGREGGREGGRVITFSARKLISHSSLSLPTYLLPSLPPQPALLDMVAPFFLPDHDVKVGLQMGDVVKRGAWG